MGRRKKISLKSDWPIELQIKRADEAIEKRVWWIDAACKTFVEISQKHGINTAQKIINHKYNLNQSMQNYDKKATNKKRT